MAIATSENYNKIIALPGGKRFHSGARVDFADGTSIELDDRNIMQGYPSIESKTSEEGQFEVGGAYSDILVLKLNNFEGAFNSYDFSGAVIRPWIGLTTAVSWRDGEIIEKVPKGVFNVTQAPQTGSIITLTAYDNLIKMDAKYSEKSKLTYPATLGQIAADACSVCGVSLATATFPNSGYSVAKRPDSKTVTCREILKYVAQLAGCFAKCNRNGNVEIRWYKEAPAGTDKYSGRRIVINQKSESTLSNLLVAGQTIESGSGDKSPDNPYILLGTQNIKTCKKNLLPNSEFAENTDGWNLSQNVVRDPSVTLDGSVSIKSEQSGLTGLNRRGVNLSFSKCHPCKAGDVFTCSAYFMTDDVSALDDVVSFEEIQYDINGVRTAWNNAGDIRGSLENNKWARLKLVVPITNPKTVSIGMYIWTRRNGRCWFARPQIEYGSTATDYEPYQGQTFALPQPLYSLQDGTADDYDAVSGSGTQNVGKVVLNGSTDEPWTLWGSDGFEKTNSLGFLIPNGTAKLLSNDNAVCNRFNFSRDADTLANSIDNDGISTGDMSYVFVIRILKSRLEGWSDDWTSAQKIAAFRAWLAANPVTVLYELASPQAITGTPQTIPTYCPYMQITNNTGAKMAAKNNYLFDVGKNAKTISAAQSDTIVTGVQIQGNDNDKTVYKTGTDDFAIRVQDNPLAQDNLQSLVNALGTQLINTTFRSYSTSAPQNPAIETGDMVYLTDQKGSRYTTIVSGEKIDYGDFETFSGDSESNADNQSKRFDKADKAQESADDAQQTADDASDKVDTVEQEFTTANGVLESKIADTKSGLESEITQTEKSLTTKISDTKTGLESEITQTEDSITLQIEDMQGDLQSQIDQNASEISTKVSDSDFNSEIDQLSSRISSKVSEDDVSSIIEQSPTEVVYAFNNKDGSEQTVRFTGDGFDFYNNGTYIGHMGINGNHLDFTLEDGVSIQWNASSAYAMQWYPFDQTDGQEGGLHTGNLYPRYINMNGGDIMDASTIKGDVIHNEAHGIYVDGIEFTPTRFQDKDGNTYYGLLALG